MWRTGRAAGDDLRGLIAGRARPALRAAAVRRGSSSRTPPTRWLLVPATEAGRLAGLGTTDPAAPFDKPAWDADTAAGLELPVYFQSRFTTSVLEDFEIAGAAAEALPHRRATARSRRRSRHSPATRASIAGYSHPECDLRDPGCADARRTARCSPSTPIPALPRPAEDHARDGDRRRARRPRQDGPDTEDPLVAMPPYGWRFQPADRRSMPAQAAQAQVVDRVNLDLKFRHAAGLGAETVRRNQEHYRRASAGDQYRDVVAANLALARLKTARELHGVVARRHVARLDRPDRGRARRDRARPGADAERAVRLPACCRKPACPPRSPRARCARPRRSGRRGRPPRPGTRGGGQGARCRRLPGAVVAATAPRRLDRRPRAARHHARLEAHLITLLGAGLRHRPAKPAAPRRSRSTSVADRTS